MGYTPLACCAQPRARSSPPQHPVRVASEWRSVRRQVGKCVRYATGEEEWYDLKKDPYELDNVPSATPQAYKDALARLQNCPGESCKAAENPL